MNRQRTRRLLVDRGDVAVETAIVLPALLGFLVIGLTVAGRSVQAKNQATSAAQEAARAASLEQTPDAAVAAAARAVVANTDDAVGLSCQETIEVDDFAPGSLVVVNVACQSDLLAGRSATFDAQAVEIVDRFRQGGIDGRDPGGDR